MLLWWVVHNEEPEDRPDQAAATGEIENLRHRSWFGYVYTDPSPKLLCVSFVLFYFLKITRIDLWNKSYLPSHRVCHIEMKILTYLVKQPTVLKMQIFFLNHSRVVSLLWNFALRLIHAFDMWGCGSSVWCGKIEKFLSLRKCNHLPQPHAAHVNQPLALVVGNCHRAFTQFGKVVKVLGHAIHLNGSFLFLHVLWTDIDWH